MQVVTFEFKRNQIIDLMKAFKLVLKDYDDPQKPGRFVVARLMANANYIVEIGLDRAKDPNHPLQKQLLKEIAAEEKAKEKNVEVLQKVSDGSPSQ
jgi:hypothetical protein